MAFWFCRARALLLPLVWGCGMMWASSPTGFVALDCGFGIWFCRGDYQSPVDMMPIDVWWHWFVIPNGMRNLCFRIIRCTGSHIGQPLQCANGYLVVFVAVLRLIRESTLQVHWYCFGFCRDDYQSPVCQHKKRTPFEVLRLSKNQNLFSFGVADFNPQTESHFVEDKSDF